MRLFWCLISLLFSLPIAAKAQWEILSPRTIADLPKGGILLESRARQTDREVRFSVVIISAKHYRFRVIDNSKRNSLSLEQAAKGVDATATINGGYFTDDFYPVGLLIANGVTIQPLKHVKLLSGVFSVQRESPMLQRTGNYTGKAEEAIQCGPFLVDRRKPVEGLNPMRRAKRTIIAEDGKGRWAVMVATHVTLADAADLLVSHGFLGDFQVERALNFDGGSSSGLWVNIPDKPFYFPPLVSVRSYLAISLKP